MPQAGKRILVGQIGAPHGVRGEVRVRAFTDDPQALVSYGELDVEGEVRTLAIRRLRPAKGVMIAMIDGVDTREAAEALKNRRLYVSRNQLPEAGEDEWYHVDLVGLEARDLEATAIGTVVAVQDFGAGDLLEVRLAGSKRSVFVPFTREIVPDVDIAAGHLTIDPPAGLLEEAERDGTNGTDAE